MNDLSLFRKHFLGFDSLFSGLDSLGLPNYPPTDVFEDNGETCIQMALAGFPKEHIDVEVKDGVLTISGKEVNIFQNKTRPKYYSKGISHKAFKHTYALRDTDEVESADLTDGLLTIKVRNNPIQPNVKKIEIR